MVPALALVVRFYHNFLAVLCFFIPWGDNEFDVGLKS